jgi:hypothetical protein
MHNFPKYLNRQCASEHIEKTWGLRCSARTLAKLAVVGGGPAFHKSGRDALYDPESLEIWAQKKISPPADTAREHRALRIVTA